MKKHFKKLAAFFLTLVSCILLLCSCDLISGLLPGNSSSAAKDPFENATAVRLMSFNIRVGEQTATRRSAVLENIREIDPDVFGVQEADPAWITYLTDNLSAYTLVGEGRDGGTNGEYAAIFYRSEKYELIQGGTKWLSLTPNTPSILDGGSQYKRVLTYAKLQDKETGCVFVHINAHLDYSSDEIARQQIDIVSEYAYIFRDYPTFITGDFNQDPESKTYQQIVKNGYLDSSLVAASANRVGTYNGYKTDVSEHSLIDYCFVSPDNVYISKYDTWNKAAENGGHENFISDHYAIYVEGKMINEVEPSLEEEELNASIFQCGDKAYGDVSFNLHDMGGVMCTLDGKTLKITMFNAERLTLSGIKTAKDVSLHITGDGELILDGDVVVSALQTSGSVRVSVNGSISTDNVKVGDGTTLIRN